MGDKDQVSRQEFNQFKTEFTERLDQVIKTIDEHIDYQKKRNEQILNYLNSDEFLNYKTKLKKHEKVT